MKKEDLKRLTGFDTFLECFAWLKRINKDKSPVIKCPKAEARTVEVFGKLITVQDEPETILIQDVKLEALEEIWRNLPTQEEIHRVNQSIDAFMPGHRRDEVLQILSKIPTK